MLDHLLPLIYREYEYFDEANKENYGYVIRRRSRPVSSTVSATSRTPPRPLRRSCSSTRVEGGVASTRSHKRRREASDDGNEERGGAKKQDTTAETKPATRSRKRQRDVTDDGDEERGHAKKQETTESAVEDEQVRNEKKQPSIAEQKEAKQDENDLVTPVKKPQEPKMSAKKAKKIIKKKVKVTEKKKTVKVSKSATPKRIPLQDITHLYVNEHARLYESHQRELSVAGLTTSVAIRFF
ncbi:uncharacterized protein PITG_16730 [Phytophthora infestans T30-4]|uniref:Uncharacterized protein n=2 Tax=Phytophthora infestans TaxID=4787 RepID=D0NVH3_PHYIT|nr:uncharacterized protein PITG_16730 [Phytophthora infestans T30-4]KAF4045940.1 hypothetical protein GN244_ATG01606 [Phytophthora infestans]EEY66650.1 conserved hypothetical protein [Phytophthora infestans T30-4]KAF4131883.1 hypothetical protein GN958_ATG18916 [Phytophthora infestans]KAI9984877.1 hypothetical protein PInf_006412 [Phytophthora infestans]KAI9984901.1 hypothetical protein PInf_006455 [Phytophthora infestans]|eukprot:XP_002896951.1 conserved hypothetical protein [Phytophthora infestans T30-4]